MAKIRACLATSGVVEQGGSKVRITREAIESLPEQITRGQAIPVGIDHDPFCLPIGKIEEVWVEPLGEELAVMARIHLEDAPSVATHRRSGVEFVHLDFEDSPEPFRARRYGNAGQRGNTLTVDMANFANPQDYTAFANDVSAIDDTITCDDAIQRHSFGPEPFLQFVISNPEISAAMAVGVWVIGRIEKFVRYTVDETLSKVADDIADTLSAKIKRILRAYDSRRSEDDRASVTQIAISSDPELILLVKSERGEEFPPLDLNNLASRDRKVWRHIKRGKQRRICS